jgi:catechol 2,3-dioxygenase-like lactoylglutathione lyase family enzyme
LKKSVEFYRERLGLDLIAEFPPKLAFFRLAETRLLIEQHDGPIVTGSVLYFEVDDVGDAQSELEQRGVSFSSQPQLIHRDEHGTFGAPGIEEWMTFFRDPDANVLALVERRAPTRQRRRDQTPAQS